MQIEVAKLEGKELNYWVQRALGWKHLGAIGFNAPGQGGPWCLSSRNDWWEGLEGHKVCGPCECVPYDYSTDWALAGPIIEREKIDLEWSPVIVDWTATALRGINDMPVAAQGDTALVAAMRAFVRSKFGDQFDETTLKQRE